MTEAVVAEHRAADAITASHPESAETLKRYVAILANRGMEWGLLGPREEDRLWQRHIGNSLALLDVLPDGVDVADVGSGAGLPGLPLTIVRPDLRVTLIEPLLRRANFLTLAVEELGLQDRVQVLRARSEDIRERFEVVVCRAVAPLEKLLKWTTPLFVGGGQLLALKGESAEDEILAAGKSLAAAGLRAEVLELREVGGMAGTRAIRVR